MKSLKKFYCKSAKVEIKMRTLDDNLDCLYLVTEEPRRKKARWKESTYKFWHREDANNMFIQLVSFWCR